MVSAGWAAGFGGHQNLKTGLKTRVEKGSRYNSCNEDNCPCHLSLPCQSGA